MEDKTHGKGELEAAMAEIPAGNPFRVRAAAAMRRGRATGVDVRGLARAIHGHCLDCIGAKDEWEVEACTAQLCRLFPYRMEITHQSVIGKPRISNGGGASKAEKEPGRGIVAGRIGKRGKTPSGAK